METSTTGIFLSGLIKGGTFLVVAWIVSKIIGVIAGWFKK